MQMTNTLFLHPLTSLRHFHRDQICGTTCIERRPLRHYAHDGNLLLDKPALLALKHLGQQRTTLK